MQLDSLDVSCPFLRAERAAASVGPEDNPVRKAADIPVKETLQLIVSKRLGFQDVDLDAIVKNLQKEFVGNCHTLFSLEPTLVSRLNLPIALEVFTFNFRLISLEN
jgi:hypothetical protein